MRTSPVVGALTDHEQQEALLELERLEATWDSGAPAPNNIADRMTAASAGGGGRSKK